jgi:hypothetical protein
MDSGGIQDKAHRESPREGRVMTPQAILVLINDLAYAIHQLTAHLQDQHMAKLDDSCAACGVVKQRLYPNIGDTHFRVSGNED